MPHSGTAAAFERVAAWLTYCATHHVGCKPPGDGKFLPKRLLDVRPVGDTGEKVPDLIRLIESGTGQQREATVPYAALSYCWGADMTGIITTTTLNLSAHSQGVPLKTLPKSIADAVAVCRGINIRYLWVDALCILQDDTDDWRTESSQMAAIYINSEVTIAAHTAASCQDGFLGEQSYGQPAWQRAFTTKFWPRGTRTLNFGQHPSQVKMFLRPGLTPDDNTTDDQLSRLMCRGWALQESLLPRRIIHYTGSEMAWECASRCICECGHVEQSQDFTTLLKTRVLRGGSWQNNSSEATWMRLVEEYTKRKLSRQSDKLVALSGLAKFILADAGDVGFAPPSNAKYKTNTVQGDQGKAWPGGDGQLCLSRRHISFRPSWAPFVVY